MLFNLTLKPIDRDTASEFFSLQPLSERTQTNTSTYKDLSAPLELPAQPLSSDDNAPLPGENYRIYQAADLLGSLPADYELVLEQGAKWCGVDESYISAAIQRFERRLCRWWSQVEKQKLAMSES